jgi:hypothetical protein
VEREGFGRLDWKEAVDVTGLDLSDIVQIDRGKIKCVYRESASNQYNKLVKGKSKRRCCVKSCSRVPRPLCVFGWGGRPSEELGTSLCHTSKVKLWGGGGE